MSGVFQNIDPPPPPHRPASVYSTAFGAGAGHTRWVASGWGSIFWILEDARNCSVLYICKYFVHAPYQNLWYGMVLFTINKEKVVLEIIEAVNKAAETKKRQYTMNTNIAK